MGKQAKENGWLHFLYCNAFGRMILKVLCAPLISKAVGWYMNTWFSKPLVPRFIKNNQIDLSQYETNEFCCFNQCFSRKIKPEYRPIQGTDKELVSPCDGLLSAYKIQNDLILPVKQSHYSLTSLLQNEKLAQQYQNGTCLVFRLCVHHYHRYCYPIGGTKTDNTFIPGKLHTVRPIALQKLPVFIQNSREYTLINSPIGSVLQMEVGALLVGKISNHHKAQTIEKGMEKGTFLYGGSTIILLLENDVTSISEEYFKNTENGIETPVIMGQLLS